MVGFSPAAFALSLDQLPNVAVDMIPGPPLEMTPEVTPRTIPAVAGRHGSRSDFSINSYEAQFPTISQVCSVSAVVTTHPAQALSCLWRSLLLVTTGWWHLFRRHGGVTSVPQLILLPPTYLYLLLQSCNTGVTRG